MYLARKFVHARVHYVIRQSYTDQGCLKSRDLFELGTDPSRFIKYAGGSAYYIDEVVEEALAEQGIAVTGDELDGVFWPFLDPELRYRLEPFRRREFRSRSARRGPTSEPSAPHHVFDRRRLFCLKTGQKNLRHVNAVPDKMFRVLDHKSRDELEQQFIDMERILRPTEVKTYVYAVFNLQDFFNESFAATVPDFLDQEMVDAFFLQELCTLNEDRDFWSGVERSDGLHEYLVRYALMFFDFDYEPRSFMDEYVRDFINRRRDYHPPPPKKVVSLEEAGEIFMEKTAALEQMSRRELCRLYRKRAQEHHPDKGGDSKKFIRLTEAYQSLLKRKKR